MGRPSSSKETQQEHQQFVRVQLIVVAPVRLEDVSAGQDLLLEMAVGVALLIVIAPNPLAAHENCIVSIREIYYLNPPKS